MGAKKIPDNYSLRLQGDDLADKAFAWIKENPQQASVLDQININPELSLAVSGYGKLSDLVKTIYLPHQQPFRADESKMERGAMFFHRYAREILTLLGLYSLPYCYAGANGVRVLYLSNKLKDKPAERLAQTGRFVVEVCEKDAFSDAGRALVSILKIRLQHAAARHFARRVIQDEVPVNQEDMLGTMLAFSLIVIRGLRKTGIEVQEKDADAYLHLWKVIGYLMGVKDTYLPDDIRKASISERQIRKREFKCSREAEELTSALLDYISAQSGRIGGAGARDLMAYLLGTQVASCLGFNKVSPYRVAAAEMGVRMMNSYRVFSETNSSVLNHIKCRASGKGAELRVL